MSDPKTARIREINEAFRRTFAGGKVTMTAGVYALPDMVKTAALQKVGGPFAPPCTARGERQDANRFGEIGSHIWLTI